MLPSQLEVVPSTLHLRLSAPAFISYRHDRQTRSLYSIQQRSKTSLEDLACI
jgi:hypothetical protein